MLNGTTQNFSNSSNLTPKFPTIRYNHFGAKQKVHVIHSTGTGTLARFWSNFKNS